jgi:hypothetical protein
VVVVAVATAVAGAAVIGWLARRPTHHADPVADAAHHYRAWRAGTEAVSTFRGAELDDLAALERARDQSGGGTTADLRVEWVRLQLDASEAGAMTDPVGALAERVGGLAGAPIAPAGRTMPRADWIAAVHRLALPTPAALAGAMYADDGARCQLMEQQLRAGADSIGALADPGPSKEAGETGQVRTGLLVDAEAASAAALGEELRNGKVAGADPSLADRLLTSGQRLLLIGERLWSVDLGPHASGLDRSLLTANGR